MGNNAETRHARHAWAGRRTSRGRHRGLHASWQSRSALARAALVLAVAVLLGAAGPALTASGGPGASVTAAAPQASVLRQIGLEGAAAYRAAGLDVTPMLGEYRYDGGYLGYQNRALVSEAGSHLQDSWGIPQSLVQGKRLYNPVSVAQYALAQYSVLQTAPENATVRLAFTRAIARLMSLQGADGAFRYSYPWKYYLSGETYQPGWVSAMTQGQAISALVRAYSLNPDERYLDAARSAYEFLQRPVADGGVRSNLAALNGNLADYVFYEEYVSTPDSYTLNGYLFTMLGIWDWSRLTAEADLPEADTVAADFDATMRTLRRILRYYDLGTFSAYDLGYLTWKKPLPHISASYHMVHIYLLHALATVTDDATVKDYEQRFLSYVN